MLLIPAAIGGYLVYRAASEYDDSLTRLKEHMKEAAARIPNQGRYDSAANNAYIALRQPVRSIPDMDLRGVPIVWNDYGSGSLVKEYSPPMYVTGGMP